MDLTILEVFELSSSHFSPKCWKQKVQNAENKKSSYLSQVIQFTFDFSWYNLTNNTTENEISVAIWHYDTVKLLYTNPFT